ncbi:hypothetical protein [Polyangium sorediatum]|uniref:DUF4240 domain-containing protein n=1 Tax=Polyangium sorediatum TaxID=889274 RepID=A0ABT6NSK9_9BACT|nr:hypothetical protein [Polyangium sorediatum]MDI1431304.1 hypothetical protein [Polyangium sorediatum]
MGRLKRGRKMEGEELAFVKAHGKLLVESLKPGRSFADTVEDFRKLEAEFVKRAGDDEFDVTETRRRIAETILLLAHDKHPPFEVCREAWNDLVRLGFSGIDIECNTSWRYADCCAYDERPDEGLVVLEPLIRKLERLFEEAKGTGTEYPAHFYENELEQLGNLRDVLEAQKRGEVVPWLETRREDEAAPPMTPEEEQADALYDAFWKAHRAAYKTFRDSKNRSFADISAGYRRVEAEFVARAGEGEAFEACVLDMRASTAEAILMAACSLHAPFQACRDAWDAFVRVGQDKSWMYPEMYVQACLRSNEPEAGLAVVEPWIAEIEQKLQACNEPLRPPGETSVELNRQRKELHELRDKFMAMRAGGAPSA